MEKRRFFWGIILSLVSAAGFGAAAPIAKGILDEGISRFLMLAIRFGISAIVVWMYVLIKNRTMEWKIKSKGEALIFIVLGTINFINTSFYFLAIQHIAISLHIVIFFTYPFFVMIFSRLFYKEKITKETAISLLLAFIGIGMTVISKNNNYSFFGIFASFSASLFFGIYLTGLGISKIRGRNIIVIVAYTHTVSALLYFASTWMMDEWTLQFNVEIWIRMITLALLSTVLAYITLAIAVRLIGPTKVAIMSTFEPIEAIFLSVVFLGEVLRFNQVIGAMFVIFAIIYMSYKKENPIKSKGR